MPSNGTGGMVSLLGAAYRVYPYRSFFQPVSPALCNGQAFAVHRFFLGNAVRNSMGTIQGWFFRYPLSQYRLYLFAEPGNTFYHAAGQ